MASAIRFNLDQSKVLSSGNGLTLYKTTESEIGPNRIQTPTTNELLQNLGLFSL